MNKKIISLLILFAIILNTNNIYANEKQNDTLELTAKSAILIEANTGKVLYEKNPDEKLSPASVTKIMTLLLIYEAVENGKIKWQDTVTISEYAASMGGSQIFLEPMQKQTVEVLTKSIAIASANDAAVAMAEFIGGSEKEFIKMMNAKAKELGMNSTNFENACGLDADTQNHYMSARDIAIVSRELMTKYPEIKKFTTTWQDTITHTTKKGEKEFSLTNTNKLIKWYDGATGLKTGSTSKAKYCLSGTATRNGLDVIAVVMASQDPKLRFQEVMKLFDYGFLNYEIINGDKKGTKVTDINVYKGNKNTVGGELEKDLKLVVKKGMKEKPSMKLEIIENIKAPIPKNAKVGEAIYSYGEQEIARINVVASENIEKANLFDIFRNLLISWIS